MINTVATFGIQIQRVEATHDINRAAAFLFLTVRDVTMFAAFLGLAIAYRKNVAVHKRLMFLATLSFAMIGIGRLVGRWILPSEHFAQFVFVCLTPILAAIAYDWLKTRRVHLVLLCGLVIYAIRLLYANLQFGLSKVWQPVGRAMLAPFLN